jgi:hypothetical protein
MACAEAGPMMSAAAINPLYQHCPINHISKQQFPSIEVIVKDATGQSSSDVMATVKEQVENKIKEL